MQKISPCLWFDNQAEEAANFYVSIFKNGKIGKTLRYGEGAPFPVGTVLTITFEIDGVSFTALNGGPHFKFNEAVSFVVDCKSQEEVDYYWNRLLEGGIEQQCGWLKDKFGVSWQIVPDAVSRLVSDPDSGQAARAMQALMKMVKIDIAALVRAADG